MWLGLLVSLIFTYSIVEMIENWRLRRSSERDLRCACIYQPVINGT
jgi:hypothetical protein